MNSVRHRLDNFDFYGNSFWSSNVNMMIIIIIIIIIITTIIIMMNFG